jgi:hypothetical protein
MAKSAFLHHAVLSSKRASCGTREGGGAAGDLAQCTHRFRGRTQTQSPSFAGQLHGKANTPGHSNPSPLGCIALTASVDGHKLK